MKPGRYCLYSLLCILMLSACQPGGSRREGAREAAQACDSTLQDAYRQLKQKITDPQQLAQQLKDFYNSCPEACRKQIATPLIEDLFNIAYANHQTEPLILPFFRELAAAAQISPTQRGKALLAIAGYYIYARRETDSAFKVLETVRKGYPALNDTLAKSYHSMMGQYMVQTSNPKAAADHYLKTIALCEKLKDSSSLAANYANYGTVFSSMGEYQKSIDMKEKAAVFFKAKKQYPHLLIGYIGIGVEYARLRRYDSAQHYYNLALDLINQGFRNPNAEFDLYISIAGISLAASQYDTARYYYGKITETIDLARDTERQRVYVMASTPAFAAVRNVDKELELIKSYIPRFCAESDLTNAKDAYYTLFHTYYLEGKSALALENYQVYDSLKSLIAREENKQYVAEMETKYETQKKELRIQVQQKEIYRSNVLNGLLVALLLAGGMGVAFVVTRIKLKRKKKDADLQQQFTRQLLHNTEEERGRIARDLHDGISQELMLLKHGISQADCREKIDMIIAEIRMISRDLHPVMLEKIGLKPSVEHVCSQMMERNLLFITTDISYTNSLSSSHELQLFRMIQEALNNIIKYAEAQAAKVTISERPGFTCTEIIDNGKGFDVTAALSNGKAFGLLSLTERSKSMQGRTEINSSPAGTLIKIEIPRSYV
ncbi:tetratricopeptide repeat-containing sensor histidine kinase [Taibaiella helva]|uniref:tetratricopeptide repeat-containing sensor histidine kinase n=1 Tax=Taibaiella helva TaxID=2301235 RepID=UPI000E5885B1|nr:sensor histidine kinase [Taibaiella helva]